MILNPFFNKFSLWFYKKLINQIMIKYKIYLSAKPGTIGGNISVIIESSNSIIARQMAEAQYGSKYRVMSHLVL